MKRKYMTDRKYLVNKKMVTINQMQEMLEGKVTINALRKRIDKYGAAKSMKMGAVDARSSRVSRQSSSRNWDSELEPLDEDLEMRREDEDQVWVWQHDGYDFTRSMCSGQAILITVEDLKDLLKNGEKIARD